MVTTLYIFDYSSTLFKNKSTISIRLGSKVINDIVSLNPLFPFKKFLTLESNS